jgi:hypothetical protein
MQTLLRLIVDLSMDPCAATSRPFYLEEIAVSASNSTLAQARDLLLEYGRFVIAQPGAASFCLGSLENEAARLPLSYHEQGGGCLMARVQGEPAGFIAWRGIVGNSNGFGCAQMRAVSRWGGR